MQTIDQVKDLDLATSASSVVSKQPVIVELTNVELVLVGGGSAALAWE